MYKTKSVVTSNNHFPNSFFSVMMATIVKDIRISMRYKANLIGGIVEVTILALSFFLLSLAIDFRNANLFHRNPPENALFIFFLSGIIVMIFQSTALYTPLNRVNRDLYNGTLEYIYSTPASRYAYFLGGIISDLIIRQIFFIPLMFVLQLIIGITFGLFVALLAFFALVTSIGVILSMLALKFKQVGNIVGIFQILFQFMGGIFIPVQSMPSSLKIIAYVLPFSYAYDLVRYYSFNGNWVPIVPLELEWLLLILSTLVFFFVSVLTLRYTEKYVKKSGLHLI